MERIKKYRVSLIFLAALLIVSNVLSLISEPIRTSTVFRVGSMMVLFALLWLTLWSCANTAKDTHPWISAFLKLFVVVQMLGGVAIAVLSLTGVVYLQFVP